RESFFGDMEAECRKSKFDPGPGLKSMTRTITAQGGGAKYSFEGIAEDGSSVSYSFVSNYDGKDSTFTGAGPHGADTIALKLVDAHKTEGTYKKGGKEVGKVTAEVSKDGKVATVKSKGKTADGKEWSNETLGHRTECGLPTERVLRPKSFSV